MKSKNRLQPLYMAERERACNDDQRLATALCSVSHIKGFAKNRTLIQNFYFV